MIVNKGDSPKRQSNNPGSLNISFPDATRHQEFPFAVRIHGSGKFRITYNVLPDFTGSGTSIETFEEGSLEIEASGTDLLFVGRFRAGDIFEGSEVAFGVVVKNLNDPASVPKIDVVVYRND